MKNYTWFNYTLWLNTRDMARLELLILNKGTWNGNALLTDQAYFNAMVNTSQTYNQSYGYLWWLEWKTFVHGANTYSGVPGFTQSIRAGRYDRGIGQGVIKIYVIPSKDLVVVRHGDDTGDAVLGPSSFDTPSGPNSCWPSIKTRESGAFVHLVVNGSFGHNKPETISVNVHDLDRRIFFRYLRVWRCIHPCCGH